MRLMQGNINQIILRTVVVNDESEKQEKKR